MLLDPSRPAADRGVTRLSGIPAPAGSSSGARGRGRTTAPCRPPQAASSARCTVRWLAPSASASAELDHDSPSARKASTAACSSSTGGASTTTSRAPRGASAKPRFVALTSASVRSVRAQPPDLDPQPGAMRFIGVLRPEGAREQRVPRHVAGPGFGERAGEREQHRARRERDHRRRRRARHCGRRRRRAPPTPAAPRPRRAGGAAPRRARSGAPPACPGRGDALSTSAVSAGMPASRAARSARASAARAGFVRRRRIAMPATTSSWAARDAGGSGAGSSAASARSASSRRPISSRRRTSR